jgi:hypothetical protein
MAYERQQPCNFIAKADADLSGLQFYAVEMTADDQIGITTLTPGVRAAGILQNKPESGQHATVCPLGVSKVRVINNSTYGDVISVADSGWVTAVDSGIGAIGFIINGCTSGGIATAFINMANATFTTSK